MDSLFFRRGDVGKAFEARSWQAIVFGEFSATLSSQSRPFPCVFGVAGYEADQLRYAFLNGMDAAQLARTLEAYLKSAREFGANTSLVVFTPPSPVRSLESYAKRFWMLLRQVSARDRHPWPATMPTRLADPAWEFCFAGEPMFVVCNTPAHVLRQSRRASTFMMTFQPRWVFDSILGTPSAAERAFSKVRRRLSAYDMLPPSPVLGQYGAKDVFEYQQYFIGDDNGRPKCPFASLRHDDQASAITMERVA